MNPPPSRPEHRFLKLNATYGIPDDEAESPAVPFWSDDYMNIDHIIPRKDIHGCDCGKNSPSNALVLSREKNIEMSNNMNHEDRIKILCEYTNFVHPVFCP